MPSHLVGNLQPLIDWLIRTQKVSMETLQRHIDACDNEGAWHIVSLVYNHIQSMMRYPAKEYANGKAIEQFEEEYLEECGFIQNGTMPEFVQQYLLHWRA